MKAKSSAFYQQEFRRRLREQGLVKKEVWILPDNARHLADIERQLRHPIGNLKEARRQMAGAEWTTKSLYEEMAAHELFAMRQAAIELIEGAEASIYVTMKEYGDLPIFMTVSGGQIIAESVLWTVADVNDVAGFNEAVLKTHKYFPLSTIGLESSLDGEDYYTMFGALSSASSLDNVVVEIETLASNVIQAVEAYGNFLVNKQEAARG